MYAVQHKRSLASFCTQGAYRFTFSVTWRHGRYLQSMTSYPKFDSVSRCIFTRSTFLLNLIPIWVERRALGFFSRGHPNNKNNNNKIGRPRDMRPVQYLINNRGTIMQISNSDLIWNDTALGFFQYVAPTTRTTRRTRTRTRWVAGIIWQSTESYCMMLENTSLYNTFQNNSDTLLINQLFQFVHSPSSYEVCVIFQPLVVISNVLFTFKTVTSYGSVSRQLVADGKPIHHWQSI